MTKTRPEEPPELAGNCETATFRVDHLINKYGGAPLVKVTIDDRMYAMSVESARRLASAIMETAVYAEAVQTVLNWASKDGDSEKSCGLVERWSKDWNAKRIEEIARSTFAN